jgi:hypothetical protein
MYLRAPVPFYDTLSDPYKAKLGFEPKSNDHESFMLPLHYLALLLQSESCRRPSYDLLIYIFSTLLSPIFIRRPYD